MTITLNEKELKDLNLFIQEMPTKFGLPLIEYLNKLASEQNKTEPKLEVQA